MSCFILYRIYKTVLLFLQDLQYGCTDKPSLPIIPPQVSCCKIKKKKKKILIIPNQINLLNVY